MWFFLFKFKSWAIRGNQGQQVNMTAECPARAQTGDLLVVRQTIYLNWESNECYKLILETLFLLQDQPRTLFEKQSHTEPWSEFWGECSNSHGFVFAEPEAHFCQRQIRSSCLCRYESILCLFFVVVISRLRQSVCFLEDNSSAPAQSTFNCSLQSLYRCSHTTGYMIHATFPLQLVQKFMAFFLQRKPCIWMARFSL